MLWFDGKRLAHFKESSTGVAKDSTVMISSKFISLEHLLIFDGRTL